MEKRYNLKNKNSEKVSFASYLSLILFVTFSSKCKLGGTRARAQTVLVFWSAGTVCSAATFIQHLLTDTILIILHLHLTLA